MPLSIPGAVYRNRERFRTQEDKHLLDALDDLADQIAANRNQGNFGINGEASPPSAPIQLSIKNSSGLYTATIVHAPPPPGARYIVHLAGNPSFNNPMPIDLGEVLTATNGQVTVSLGYFPGQKFFARVAAKFPASNISQWTYFGGPVAPVSA